MATALKVRFDTTEFEFSHGRGPRGFGSWAFEVLRSQCCLPRVESSVADWNSKAADIGWGRMGVEALLNQPGALGLFGVQS